MRAKEQEVTNSRPVINLEKFIGLVDADGLIYRYAAANDKEDDLEEVLKDVEQRVLSLEEELNCRAYIHIVSGKHNFRNHLGYTKKYKGTRDPNNKPVWFDEVAMWYNERFNVVVAVDCEADDACIMLHDADTIIVSADKDLLQSPGRFVITRTKEIPGNEFPYFLNEKFVTEEEGHRRLVSQLISGDTVDNIPGLSGVGPVAIAKLFKGAKKEDFARLALGKFQEELGIEKGLDAFVEMYSLVRMRTNQPGSYLNEKYDYLFRTLNLYRKHF